MSRERKLYELAEKLVEWGWRWTCPGGMCSTALANRRARGLPDPEEFKPGRLIEKLSKEEKELAKDLKAKHFNHRDTHLFGD